MIIILIILLTSLLYLPTKTVMPLQLRHWVNAYDLNSAINRSICLIYVILMHNACPVTLTTSRRLSMTPTYMPSWYQRVSSSQIFSLPTDTDLLLLTDYILVRNDRVGRRDGGVAIYIHCYLLFKILASFPPCLTTAEFLLLEVSVGGTKIVLRAVWCPSSIHYFSSQEAVLESLGSAYAYQVIMRAFNTDLTNLTSRSCKLLQNVESARMKILPV